MSVVLSEHLSLLATAPDGIQKLRGLILELAVRGKLVPQDPNDEPASELLKWIAKERARLEAEGVCKKSKAMPEVGEDEQPYVLPKGWEWVRLGHFCLLEMGQSPPSEHYNQSGEGIPFFQGKADFGAKHPTARYWCTEPTKYADNGDVLLSVRAPVGPTNIAQFRCCIGRGLAALRPLADVPTGYVSLAIRARRAALENLATGTTFVAVSKGDIEPFLIPVPPLEEQHRNVAKVDELMALCDRLEAEQTDAEAAHARLVETLLGTLTQSTDVADLAANWQRLAEHFDTLFTTESSLDAVKQTILHLAVTGQLMPEGTTSDDRATPSEGRVLPAGWRLEPINEFCSVQGGIQKTPLRRPVKNHYPYLRVANVQRGDINLDELARYELTQEELVRWRLNAGDLLIVEGNGSESEIGRCAIWRGQVADCVYQNHLIRVRPHVSEQVDYIQLFLNSPIGIGTMKRLAITTSGLYNLSVGKIRGIEVPLPPLAEQHRIVAKVDELMVLCNRLKADVAESRARQARLSATLIESALAAA